VTETRLYKYEQTPPKHTHVRIQIVHGSTKPFIQATGSNKALNAMEREHNTTPFNPHECITH